MKHFIIIISILFIVVDLNSQYYAFGAFNYSALKTKNGTNENFSTNREFEFSPGIGYYINDRWDIGLELGVRRFLCQYETETNLVELKTTTWNFAPFTCCVLIQWGKLALSGRSSLFFESDFNENYLLTGIQIVPFFEYSLNDKITLLTDLNFLGGGYYYGNILNNKFSNFYLGFDSDNILTLSDIRVGFIYNF